MPAGRTAHGREIPSAIPAGFFVLADFAAAVIAKKARFFVHFYSGFQAAGFVLPFAAGVSLELPPEEAPSPEETLSPEETPSALGLSTEEALPPDEAPSPLEDGVSALGLLPEEAASFLELFPFGTFDLSLSVT